MITASSTIIACCTGIGGGGSLAIIRLSGSDTLVIGDRFIALSNRQRIVDQPSHTIHHGYVMRDSTVRVDEIMVTIMRAPKTFTGEDTVEITCHNNPLIIEEILQLAIEQGARPAERGEFTRLAFMNNKIDLIQAEAIHELITAPNQEIIRASLAQLSGSLSQRIRSIESALLTSMAWCEASFEFIDEVGEFGTAIHDQIEQIVSTLETITRIYAPSSQLRNGIRIVLVGTPNAGKSSLFNALIGSDRAIVTPIAGTTRDTIEASVARSGSIWTLVDTAGVRETTDSIEKEGIDRSWREVIQADIIILVIDSTHIPAEEDDRFYQTVLKTAGHKTIIAYNKIDIEPNRVGLHTTEHTPTVRTAVPANIGINTLEAEIITTLDRLRAMGTLPFMVNERQYRTIIDVQKQLNQIQALIRSAGHAVPYELISIHLQEAIATVSELTGKSVSGAALDEVFKTFCIGK